MVKVVVMVLVIIKVMVKAAAIVRINRWVNPACFLSKPTLYKVLFT